MLKASTLVASGRRGIPKYSRTCRKHRRSCKQGAWDGRWAGHGAGCTPPCLGCMWAGGSNSTRETPAHVPSPTRFSSTHRLNAVRIQHIDDRHHRHHQTGARGHRRRAHRQLLPSLGLSGGLQGEAGSSGVQGQRRATCMTGECLQRPSVTTTASLVLQCSASIPHPSSHQPTRPPTCRRLLHSATMPSHSCSVCFWLGSPVAFCGQARGCRQHAVSSTSSGTRLPPHAAPGTAAHAIGLLPNARPPIHLGGVGNVHCIVAEQHAGVGKVGEVEEDLGGGATPHLHHACRQVGVWGGRSVQSEVIGRRTLRSGQRLQWPSLHEGGKQSRTGAGNP